MTLPAAGWFPDPRDQRLLRWWDGRTWAEETRPAPGTTIAPPVSQAAAEATTSPRFSVATAGTTEAWACGVGVQRSVARGAVATRWFCLWAWSSVVVACLSVLVDPRAILSLLGVGFGIVGVLVPRGTGGWRVVGRSMSSSAIVLALATGVVAVLGQLT